MNMQFFSTLWCTFSEQIFNKKNMGKCSPSKYIVSFPIQGFVSNGLFSNEFCRNQIPKIFFYCEVFGMEVAATSFHRKGSYSIGTFWRKKNPSLTIAYISTFWRERERESTIDHCISIETCIFISYRSWNIQQYLVGGTMKMGDIYAWPYCRALFLDTQFL